MKKKFLQKTIAAALVSAMAIGTLAGCGNTTDPASGSVGSSDNNSSGTGSSGAGTSSSGAGNSGSTGSSGAENSSSSAASDNTSSGSNPAFSKAKSNILLFGLRKI